MAKKSSKRKARKEEKKNRKKIRTGGFVDEIYEDDLDEEPETSEENQSGESVQVATSEAHELLKKEIAAATADESSGVRLHRYRKNWQMLQKKFRILKNRKKNLRFRKNRLRSKNWLSRDILLHSLLTKREKQGILLIL